MKKLLSLSIIFISIPIFLILGIKLTHGQTNTYPECLQFEVKFNATGWSSETMGNGMDVACGGDYGPSGCRGGVKRVQPGESVTLDRCTCTPYGDPRYDGRGCLVIGKNLSMEDYDAGGITRRRVVRAPNSTTLPTYCSLTVKGKTYDYRSTDFFPSKAQYDADNSLTFCGVNGTEKDKQFSVNCNPLVSVPPVVSCPVPEQVTNVKITCPNCISDSPTLEQQETN